MKKMALYLLALLIMTMMISCSSGEYEGDSVSETTLEITTTQKPVETTTPKTTEAPAETRLKPVKYDDMEPYIPTVEDKPIVTNLGNFTKTIYIRMNDGGYDKDGTPVLYFVTDGNPKALFVIANAVTGEILREFELEHSTGAWEVFVHSSKDVYISGHGKPYFYVYNHEEDKIENIGTLPAGSSLGQVMCEGENGIVYSGSTDSLTYWGYDPNKNELFAMPQLIDNATRHMATVYDPVDQKLYVSVLSKDSKNLLFRVDPLTLEKTDITPAEYIDAKKYNFYDMDLYGDVLVIRYPSTAEMILYDIRKNELIGFQKENSDTLEKVIITNCRQPAADPEDSTKFYTVISGKLVLFDTVTRTYSVTRTNASNNFIRMVFLELGGKYEGWSACSLYGHEGSIQFSSLSTSLNYVMDTDVSGQANVPNCFALTKSGVLYIGGGFGGSTGLYDVKTGESTIYSQLGQTEGMVAYNNTVYFGTYPQAVIHFGAASMKNMWAVKSVLTMGNSTTIAGYEPQDRPYTFLAIPEEKLVAVCSVPAQNSYTGAMALFDAGTNRVIKHIAFPVDYQCGVSMAYKDGVIYIGTSTRAGYGTDAKVFKALLLAYDIESDTFTEYELPMSPAAAVTALTIADDGKLYGFAYNFLFCFDTEKREFVSYKQQDIVCNNQTWREFTLTPGDDTCIFASCSYTKTLYRISLEDMIAVPIAEGVGWHHIMDHYGNFYFLNDINVYKVSFKE